MHQLGSKLEEHGGCSTDDVFEGENAFVCGADPHGMFMLLATQLSLKGDIKGSRDRTELWILVVTVELDFLANIFILLFPPIDMDEGNKDICNWYFARKEEHIILQDESFGGHDSQDRIYLMSVCCV